MNEQDEDGMRAEEYREILAAVKAKDKKIDSLETELNKLKEAIKTIAESKKGEENKITGYCNNCNTPLTVRDAALPNCPHCGRSGTYRIIP